MSVVVYCSIEIIMPKNYLTEIKKSLDDEITALIPQLKELSLEESCTVLEKFSRAYGVSIMVEDLAGESIINVGEIAYEQDPDAGVDELRISKAISKIYTFETKDKNKYIINVWGDKEIAEISQRSLRKTLPYIVGVAVGTAVLIAYFFTRYIARPILKMSQVSRKLSKLDFQTKVDCIRSDEIGELGENLNELAISLDTALTELNEANLKLQQDIQKEKEMETQQLAFFSAVSHELKTPITVIKGQLEGMILKIGGYSDREKYLRRSLQVVCTMDNLVREILSVSQMKSSGFCLNKQRVNVSNILRQVIVEQEDLATNRGIDLEVELDNELWIYADDIFFQKVISNLLSNAIKYATQSSQIKILSYLNDENIIISIENECKPIPEEEIYKLFEPFYRREESRNRSTGGSGLGLYIVKIVLDLHKFSYKFENTVSGVKVTICC